MGRLWPFDRLLGARIEGVDGFRAPGILRKLVAILHYDCNEVETYK